MSARAARARATKSSPATHAPDATQQETIRSVAIIGLGVIGGSLALAIRRADPTITIIGYARERALEAARTRSIADVYTGDVTEAVRTADCVFVCTPVHTILDLLPEIARVVKPQTIVTDVGSTKEAVCLYAKKLFRRNGIFIGGHPMAGSEGSGIGYADALLFQNAVYVLCPVSARPEASRRLAMLVQSFGARVFLMKPGEHDRIAACISHVPQLAAVALMQTAGKKNETNGAYLQLAAGGFRDMTRIASSPYGMWNDILATNSLQIKRALSDLQAVLFRFERQLGDRNFSAFNRDFTKAKTLRDRIPKNVKGFLAPLFDVYVSAEDRPGILATITSALARAGVNIKDIELLKIREGESGTFRLGFESEAAAECAITVLAKKKIKAGR
ncbi:MAG TPA: prephenate dehydrogenase [Bacteroidota bacterium]|nr:prephenate dehydrogenase [Bacteroidota bacterium]